ncbi:MAG TPA: flagellar hook-basal body protein [Clostridia bacterium]|nr:flagellar hook-basal body protein [Clostridia bacterium]
MNCGIYAAASGMAVQRDRMDAVANNMENVATTGYKRDQGTINSFKDILIYAQKGNRGNQRLGTSGFGANFCQAATAFMPGPIAETGRNTDFALTGDGFFVLQGEDGHLYTRDGAFSVDDDGYLTGAGGRRVLGERGTIQLSRRDESIADISPDDLMIYEFENKLVLEKQGGNCFKDPEGEGRRVRNRGGIVKQGFLEGSNVDLATEIVDMMAVLRAYEAGQKVLHAQDELTERVLRVGSMR